MSTLKLKTIKRADEITLEGITADLVLNEHGTPLRLVLTDVKGKSLYLGVEYSALSISVEAPPKLVEAYRVEGTLDRDGKVPYAVTFEEEYKANSIKADLTGEMPYAKLTVTKIEVPEDSIPAR